MLWLQLSVPLQQCFSDLGTAPCSSFVVGPVITRCGPVLLAVDQHAADESCLPLWLAWRF
jgi:hypothetical protein